MKKKIMILSMLSSILTLANPRIQTYEILNQTKIPKTVIREILKYSSNKDFDDNVLKEVETNFMNTGLVDKIKIEPVITGEKVKLKINIVDKKNIDEGLKQIAEIEEMKKPTQYTIKDISVVGTKFDMSELIKQSNLKIGDKLTIFNAKTLENLAISTGYFKYAEVKIQELGNNDINLELNVIENPTIKSVSIKGTTLVNEAKAIQLSGLKSGDVLNLNLIYQNSPLLQEYVKSGYNWVMFSNVDITDDGNVRLEVKESKVSDIIYVAPTGKTEDLKTKPFVLERNTYVKKGDVLNQKTIETSVRELQRTGLFNRVEPELKEDPASRGDVILIFKISERPSMSIGANVSYSTSESLGGSLTFGDTNLVGTDQSISISANGSIKGNYGLSLGYKNNWVKGTDRLLVGANLFFNGSKTKVSNMYKKLPKDTTKKDFDKKLEDLVFFEPTARQFQYGLSGQVGKGLTEDLYVVGTAKLLGVYGKNKYQDINYEKKEDGSGYTTTPGKKGVAFEDYNLAAIGASITYDTRDDRVNPRSGFYANASLNAGYIFRDKSVLPSTDKIKVEGSELSLTVPDKDKETNTYKTKGPRGYVGANFDLRAYHRVYKDYNSMAYRLVGGASHPNTPSGELFTIGDGVSMRGQKGASSYNLGASATVENRTYINDYLQGVVFYEMALVGKKENNKLQPKFAHDIGLGARVTTPIGVLRLDYAWDLPAGKIGLKEVKKPSGKFTFGIGHTF